MALLCSAKMTRSQHRNRAEAMNMMKAHLYKQELCKQEEKAQSENAEKSTVGWGSQIRSYVLHPYQLVKDLRTGVETSKVLDVLDGDIDLFIEAALAHRVRHIMLYDDLPDLPSCSRLGWYAHTARTTWVATNSLLRKKPWGVFEPLLKSLHGRCAYKTYVCQPHYNPYAHIPLHPVVMACIRLLARRTTACLFGNREIFNKLIRV